ncbi:MAG: dienelactone hydrolase family protein [Actinomycetota bacterium]|nr:dienelactone hydrolase family protein [Actinomycetota bacterium]
MGTEGIEIRSGDATLEGDLSLPAEDAGVVVFAHGSGSSRHSPRNQAVARELGSAGLGTLLIDLLTSEEEQVDLRTGRLRFDIGFLAERVAAATRWLRDRKETAQSPIGYFGASTGAAAALVAAANSPGEISAIVSRGGRPDLAGEALAQVQAPTLLIVGGEDQAVIPLNEEARDRLSAPVRLEIVPGATHLFEEPGALERVSELATQFFGENLRPKSETSDHP